MKKKRFKICFPRKKEKERLMLAITWRRCQPTGGNLPFPNIEDEIFRKSGNFHFCQTDIESDLAGNKLLRMKRDF